MIPSQWYLWDVKVPKKQGMSPSGAFAELRVSISICRTIDKIILRSCALLAFEPGMPDVYPTIFFAR